MVVKPKKSKINECAVCASTSDLEPQLSTARGLYFLCRRHAAIDRVMWQGILDASALRRVPAE